METDLPDPELFDKLFAKWGDKKCIAKLVSGITSECQFVTVGKMELCQKHKSFIPKK